MLMRAWKTLCCLNQVHPGQNHYESVLDRCCAISEVDRGCLEEPELVLQHLRHHLETVLEVLGDTSAQIQQHVQLSAKKKPLDSSDAFGGSAGAFPVLPAAATISSGMSSTPITSSGVSAMARRITF